MVELEDLPNVGEKTAEKLRDAGFADMMRQYLTKRQRFAMYSSDIQVQTRMC